MYILFAILSAISASLVAIFAKIGLEKVDTTLATAIRAVIMALLLVLTTLFLRKWDLSQVDNKTFLFILLAGGAGAISWFFYFLALRFGPASAVAALDRLSVVFVIFFATLFLGESLSIRTVLGAILVVLAAILLIK